MARKLTANSSLESLKKEAKRWLKALHAGEPRALARLKQALPGAGAAPGLREIQQALAHEFGAESWAALKLQLADEALARRTHAERLEEFLEHAILRYGVRPRSNTWDEQYYDDPSRWQYAARILKRHPGIVKDSIHAAAVSGDLAEVRRILAKKPSAALDAAALDGKQPLVYVCYGRLPLDAVVENSVEIARLLIDAGAPCHYVAGNEEGDFRPITGAIGGGEAGQPPHPQAVALAELLIGRGADPYDPQTLYNTSLGTDDLFWLDFLYSRSAQRNETQKWNAHSPRWPQTGILDYLLTNAVSNNHIARARWTLDRGANAQSPHFYSKQNLHTEAVLNGYTEIADLLLQFGAKAEPLTPQQEFLAACMRMDRETVKRLVAEHPEYLRNPHPLHFAASHNLPESARFLLDLGTSPDVANGTNFRPLHAAATANAVKVAQLLIERGAEIDPRETRFNGTPLSWAVHHKATQMIGLLSPLSCHLSTLVYTANVTRLRELFTADPALAKTVDKNGSLLHCLPDDDDRALEVAALLLEFGADPSFKCSDGLTPADAAERNGMDAAAQLLRDAQRT